MKRIGIYGGTFDPIHMGHLNLAVEMLEKHHLDEVRFCPTAINPHKSDQTPVSVSHRLNMIRLAIENEPRFSVSDIEINRPGLSYTVDTLKELHALQKEGEIPYSFFLILGEDTAESFHRWHKPEEILDMAQLLVGTRWDKNKERKPFEGNAKIKNAIDQGLTSTRVMDVSSQEIRMRLLNKKYCYHLLSGKVMDYILTNHLYYVLLNVRF